MVIRPSNNITDYISDWNKFIRDILGARLCRWQRKVVDSVQHERRVSVRSGHAAGKDHVAAAISLCFLYLHKPSKVVNTAPTGRQVISIMMSEIGRLYHNARVPLGGELQANRIIFTGETDWYLLAFKASDTQPEAWHGFHSENILIVVTEASGIEQQTFDAIDGCLTGTISRLLIVFNPTSTTGEAYQSTRSPQYAKHQLNCLKAPNVRAKKILIPGQVDYDWVKEKLTKPGWVRTIDAAEADPVGQQDFCFEGQWYRPYDLFRVKVQGEFPKEPESQVIPLSWIEASNQRWLEQKEDIHFPMMLGTDFAGMGNDRTVFAERFDCFVKELQVFGKQDHMESAGKIRNRMKEQHGYAILDSIGEGAGVYSRLIEMNVDNVVSGKFSYSSEGFHDITGERNFLNMRSFCYWAVRDALDPKFNGKLALPPDEELTQELTAQQVEKLMSNGQIVLKPKDDIKKELGRSPDKADAVALTFWPLLGGWGSVSASAKR